MAALTFDVVIVGSSFGGVSAALAAARYGKRIALVDAGPHVGGQATSQGLNRWDETVPVISPNTYGSTRSYQEIKHDVRRWYEANATLAHGVDVATLNPGFKEPNRQFSADCRVVETVLRKKLQDVAANVELILGNGVTSADVENGVVRALHLANGDTVSAAIFVDSTDLGDLLALCGVACVIGAEAKSDTQEPHAETVANEGYIQPITVPIAVEHALDGKDWTIERPAIYSDALIGKDGQDFVVDTGRNGLIGGVFTSKQNPDPKHRGYETIFNYRQYIDHSNFADPAYATDRTTINVGSNDYQAAVIPTGDAARDAAIVEDARQVSRAYLYWLQTAAPHDDDGSKKGYQSLKVREDIFGRDDGTAPDAYIRESRRIAKPVVRVLEQHIATTSKAAARARSPMNFSDSCGICYFPIDVHKVYGPPQTPWQGDVDGSITVRPFQIPLGALIPTDATNLIAGCKNIGATHLTGGAYRVHPGEWAVGEAAGTLAAYCAGQGVTPAQVHANGGRVAALQLRLLEYGAPIFWWTNVDYDQGVKTFAAANLLGVRGFMADPDSLDFRPDAFITQHERDAIDSHLGRRLPWPVDSKKNPVPTKRPDAARWLCGELALPSSDVVARWDA